MIVERNVVPTKKQLKEAPRLLKEIDWSRFDAMSDKDLEKAWSWDMDMTWPSDKDLARCDWVIPAKTQRKRRKAAE